MLAKTDFTAEEWNLIRRAPLMAGLVVVAASPSGPFGVVKEMSPWVSRPEGQGRKSRGPFEESEDGD